MLPFLRDHDHDPSPMPLPQLVGQAVIHTRVAARGTWTATARGWSLHARSQVVDGSAVGLRDPRVVGAVIEQVVVGSDGTLHVTLTQRTGHASLMIPAPWLVAGPLGAAIRADEKGRTVSTAPSGPEFATADAMAAHRASTPSGLERTLLRRGLDEYLHPGHVVEALLQSGAVEDEEFERRGPLLLARLLARGDLRAGFLTGGRFTPWDLPVEEVIEHVGTTWRAVGGREPRAGMIGWFELTRTGEETLGPTGDAALGAGMSGYDSPGVVGGFR